MRLMEFCKLRDGVQINARPGDAADLRFVAHELRRALEEIGVFTDVEVETTDNLDHLVVAMCTYAPFLVEEEVAYRLEEVWNTRLRYSHWAAHSTLVTQGQVELQGASLGGVGGPYITLHLVAQQASVPVQRVAGD